MSGRDNFAWTEDRVSVLTKLWAEGLSGSQIARRLGGITRNAVIGKVHRLGLAARVPSRADGGVRRTYRKAKHSGGKPKFMNFSRKMTIKSSAKFQIPAPDTQNKHILDLKIGECRHPTGTDHQTGDHLFCGCKTNGGSFCDHHETVNYQTWVRKR